MYEYANLNRRIKSQRTKQNLPISIPNSPLNHNISLFEIVPNVCENSNLES